MIILPQFNFDYARTYRDWYMLSIFIKYEDGSLASEFTYRFPKPIYRRLVWLFAVAWNLDINLEYWLPNIPEITFEQYAEVIWFMRAYGITVDD